MSSQDPQTTFLQHLNDHRGILFKVTAAYCRARSDREDLAQEIIAQMWRSYARYDHTKPFSTWMYRVAVNVAISFYRKNASYRRNLITGGDTFLETVAIPPDEPDENLDVLHSFIAQLDDLNRALIILYLDDNSYAAIAEILGLSETNVATKIARIKQKMKQNAAGVPAGEGR